MPGAEGDVEDQPGGERPAREPGRPPQPAPSAAPRDDRARTARRKSSGRPRHIRFQGRASARSGGATPIRRTCWTMWTQKSSSARPSIGESSAATIARRPGTKAAVRQRRRCPAGRRRRGRPASTAGPRQDPDQRRPAGPARRARAPRTRLRPGRGRSRRARRSRQQCPVEGRGRALGHRRPPPAAVAQSRGEDRLDPAEGQQRDDEEERGPADRRRSRSRRSRARNGGARTRRPGRRSRQGRAARATPDATTQRAARRAASAA